MLLSLIGNVFFCCWWLYCSNTKNLSQIKGNQDVLWQHILKCNNEKEKRNCCLLLPLFLLFPRPVWSNCLKYRLKLSPVVYEIFEVCLPIFLTLLPTFLWLESFPWWKHRICFSCIAGMAFLSLHMEIMNCFFFFYLSTNSKIMRDINTWS